MKRMRFRHAVLFTLLLGLAIALPAREPWAAADSGEVVTSLRLPLVGTIQVTLEDGSIDTVDLAGPLHVVARYVPPNPIIPEDTARLEVEANPQGVDGSVVDGTSSRGRRYNLVGSDSGLVTVPPNPIEPILFSFGFHLQSTGTDGFASPQGVAVSLQLDSSGAVTSGTASFEGSGAPG